MIIIDLSRIKRIRMAVVAAAILVSIMVWNLSYTSIMETFKDNAKGIIVIDAGHGGNDMGASSRSGVSERDINLIIAKKLEGLLQREGFKVILTRRDEKAIAPTKSKDMAKRVDIANSSDADIFVSIHLNKFSQSQYYGAQTFYMEGSQQGEKLAKAIQSRLLEELDRGNTRQAKASNSYYVIRNVKMPAVIVECGFLSNPDEEKLLQQDEYQQDIAHAIYMGIKDYFSAAAGTP
ncbi:N-acetylmuramoyl-L-alanine amidase CwlD [Mahella australiensis]|uniref:N-acetylmuramoyl-L-alanine amidase CwlD n=1 Tax=Mahella australiensis (strain DSM 15567 / CIP 107919 / 50-1 BON) TaxID=697281 RepID=F3ZXZ7_MAHA5|nr:N-acetylmuramoyl-L-alanine amidase CwlD [Mahella australiensis]AEE96667.1 N-acetylmuramoyl-L-alanine amidase CwlD [Mahella australiensis 50-1 BON]